MGGLDLTEKANPFEIELWYFESLFEKYILHKSANRRKPT